MVNLDLIELQYAMWFPIVFLLCHFIGDYFLQSDWIALNKNKRTFPCLVHVFIYTSCFLLLTTSWSALLFIGITHFILDRFPIIIKRLIWWRNHFPLMNYPHFGACSTTGYFDDSPYNEYQKGKEEVLDNFYEKMYGKPRHFFITMWLYIIHDNVLHLVCNLIALMLF